MNYYWFLEEAAVPKEIKEDLVVDISEEQVYLLL